MFGWLTIVLGGEMNWMKKEKLTTITGKNIILRPITLDDTDLIVKWRNNPSVVQNFIFREKFTKEMHENWMRTKVESGQVIQYIVEEKKSGRPIGSVYFRDVNENYNSAEFGIFIGEDDARGKGYGKEITSLFVRYGLESLGLHRIQLRLVKGNAAAARTYSSVGFHKEGEFRDMVKLGDEYRTVIFMSILDSDI